MEADGNTSLTGEEQEQILYDIVTYKEWEQEPEVVKKTDSVRAPRWLGSSGPGLLPPTVERIQGAALSWQFAVSRDGAFIAVLQEAWLEVWSSREQYNTLVWRRPVERDPAPQWRRIQWTEDFSLLAVAQSNGSVEVCDTMGGGVYSLISPCIPASQPGWTDTLRTGPSSNSYCAMFFTSVRLREKKWCAELVLVEFSGRISSFLVSHSGYQELSSHTLGWSLTAAAFCPAHSLLITAGGAACPLTGKRKLVGRASHQGIVALRLLNDSPHYINMLDGEELQELGGRGFSLPFFYSAPPMDHITSVAVSGCGSRFAALHESGTVTVWNLPSFLLESSIQLSEQPSFDECNPQLLQAPHRKRAKNEFLSNPLKYHPVDLAWWNHEAVVLARMSGAITVLGTQDLSNLLGDSPEFLEGVPRISQCLEKGFFGLECDLSIRGRRPSSFDDSAGEDPDVELEDSDGEGDEGWTSWLTLGKRGASSIAYYITDSEAFAPPKKKAKIVRKTYRLMALVSTSPEELYARKIAAEEYGEAIMLAQHYGLDTDLVYERQWRRSNKSGAAIQDYLAKMKKRVLVLKEVLETVPEDLDSVRHLLEYGLKGTDLEALLALGPGSTAEDKSLFVLCDPQRVMEEFETEEKKEELERAARSRLVARVNWESLSLIQKDLIWIRLQLLYYLDCLDTIEDILGGGVRAAERFNPLVYARLRKHAPLENCLMAAREGDATTVMGILSSGAYGPTLRPHWLPILSCFPETVSPSEYNLLLPSVSHQTGRVEELWCNQTRDLDWAEQPLAIKWSGHKTGHPVWDPANLYTENMAAMEQFQETNLTPSLLSRWYETRARDICQQSSLPSLALELLQMGLERGVTIDWRLLHHIRTLDCLVYDVQLGDTLDLAALEKLQPVEQMRTLLLGWETDPLMAVRRQLVPFLQRLEDNCPGEMGRLLTGYCTVQAVSDLTFPLVVVEHSGPDKTGPILYSVVDTVRLALDCCYASQSWAQLELMDRMYQCVVPYVRENPQTRQTRYNISRVMKTEVDQLKIHLDIASILLRNGVVRPLVLLRDEASNASAMRKLFDAVLSRAEAARPALEQDGWRTVFRDLQLLQNLLPVVGMEGVIYSYCESLLSSGSVTNISLAGSVLEGMMSSQEQVDLIVTAWRHYYSTSSGLADPVLDLARQVLGLLQPAPRQLDECYDLLAALQSMEDFGLSHILPLTILETKDRLNFVRLAVQTKSTAYKNSQRLMKLASLLKISSDEMEGEVWAIIARRALELDDCPASLAACNNMIRLGFTKGWDVCYALAAKGEFSDLEKSLELLAFAVCHCDRENIEDVMQTLIMIEHKSLTQKLALRVDSQLMEKETGEEDDEQFEDTMEEMQCRHSRETSPVELLLHIPSLSRQFLMNNRVSGKLWQQTASWVTQLSSASLNRSVHEDEIIDKDFESVRMPAFYLSITDTLLEGLLDATYDRFSRPSMTGDIALASYQVLRISGLADTLAVLVEGRLEQQQSVSPELLQQLLPLVASQDINLGLLLLLSLETPEDAIKALETLPRSFPGFCFALTHFSMLVLAEHLHSLGEEPGQIFNLSPIEIVRQSLILQRDSKNPSPLAKICFAQMKDYLDLATDFHQGNLLSSLSGDVDVSRFTCDSEYKEDTILGLALYTEEDKWKFTLSLARRYNLGLWMVAVTHAEALLTDPSISCTEAKRLVEERELVDRMLLAPEKCAAMMESKVLPLLSGEDTQRLLLYYNLQSKLGVGDQYQVHITALTKISDLGIKIDYNLLIAGNRQVLDQVTEDNVETVAELVDLLGAGKEADVNSSTVYATWASKAFMDHGQNKGNWIEAFSLCQKFMDKMKPGDYKIFVRQCILSSESLRTVPRPARGRIFKKAVKHVEVKMVLEPKEWSDTNDWLDVVKNHLDKFKQALSGEIIAKLGESNNDAVEEFEMTGGEVIKILQLLASLIVEDREVAVVLGIMQLWKQQKDDVSEAGLELLTATAAQLNDKDTVSITSSPIKLLETLVCEYSLPGSQVSDTLSTLCTDENVSVSDRLALVRILKGLEVTASSTGNELDSSFLAELYQTQHDIQNILPNFTVVNGDLEGEQSRLELFHRLLTACSCAEEVRRIYCLVKEWDVLETGELLSSVACRLLDLDTEGEQVLELLSGAEEDLSKSEAASVLEHYQGFDQPKELLIVQLALVLDLEEKYPEIKQVLAEKESCSATLASLIVRRGLVPQLVTSTIYPSLVSACLEVGGGIVDTMVDQLREAGLATLAASIQMQSEGVPGGLRTLTSLAMRWLAK